MLEKAMRTTARATGRAALAVCGCLLALPAGAGDWPQWRGPARDACSDETGLLAAWPAEGPPLLWVAHGLGASYASTAVAGGCVYVTGAVDGEGLLFCLSLDGELLYKVPYGPEGTKTGPYARTTPTVVGDLAYLMTARGRVVCVDLQARAVRWDYDTVERHGAKQPAGGHGISESVLVVGDHVICTPGGEGASVIALERASGRLAWRTAGLSEVSGFNQPLAVPRRGRTLVVAMTEQSMLGLDAADGKVLWREPFPEKAGPCLTPVFHADVLYVPTGKGGVAEGWRLSEDGAAVRRLWTQKRMTPHHGGVVAVGGYVYGCNGHWRALCLDVRNGNVMYESTRRTDPGAVAYAEGRIYLQDVKGKLRLVLAVPAEYREIGSFAIPHGAGEYWSHPAVAYGRLFVRHGEALMAYDLRDPHAAKDK